jgi:dipeptidyl-peptidase-4
MYDLASKRLLSLSRRAAGLQQFAKFSPDSRRVGFVRNRNLFVVDLLTGSERQLTFDGSDGRVINGTFDWVYEEEFGLRDGWSWSPDGSRIAFYKLDESETREYQLMDLRDTYPVVERYRYPKAGESNSEVKIGIIGINTGTVRYVETATWNDEESDAEYIPRVGWTAGAQGSKLWILRLNRDQNRVDVLLTDPDSANVRMLLSEEEDTWINVNDDRISFLGDGQHFVWASERTGFNHLYLYGVDGTLVTPITSGDWEVTDFHGVDEATGYAYFTGTVENAIERHLYRIAIPDASENAIGPSPERVSDGAGTHRVDFSSDLRFYIDSYSNATTPTVVSLHEASGTRLKGLEANAELVDRLSRYDLPEPEFTTLPGAAGDLLNAYLIKPTDFDPLHQYPVLMYVYGGPGSQTVVDSWGGSRYLWHAYLAQELGLVVVSVDGRGTGARGKEFTSQTYRRLGVVEAADQIAAAQAISRFDYVDSSRIAIWGWSYGGYLTLMSLLTDDGPTTFKVGMAVAPVSDWRLYDTIYTERYMSTPQSNPDGYTLSAPLAYADRLGDHQRLLLVHGDLDDNVHYQQSIQMADGLQAADEQFDMMIYPGRNHGIFGDRTRLHLFTLLTRYLRDHL